MFTINPALCHFECGLKGSLLHRAADRWLSDGPNPPDFDVVGQQPAVDGLGGVGHEGPAFEAGLLEEPGQSSTVVQVEANRGRQRSRLMMAPGTGYIPVAVTHRQREREGILAHIKYELQIDGTLNLGIYFYALHNYRYLMHISSIKPPLIFLLTYL